MRSLTPVEPIQVVAADESDDRSDREQIEALKQKLAERDATIAELWQQLEVSLADVARLYEAEHEVGDSEIESMPPAPPPLPAAPSRAEPALVPSPSMGDYPTLQNVSLKPPQSGERDARDSVPPSGDQRRDGRRKLDVEIEFTDDTHFFAGLTCDVSRGGLFIATYHHFDIGTELRLSFELPDGTPVEARGEVRWLKDASSAGEGTRPGFGVAFTELSESDAQKIRVFCASRPPLLIDL